MAPVYLLFAALVALCVASPSAFAQEEEPEMTFDEEEAESAPEPEEGEMTFEVDPETGEADEGEPEPEPDFSMDFEAEGEVSADGASASASLTGDDEDEGSTSKVSWQDIVVVVRKPFLKVGRAELLPTWGVTMNDNIIQHVQLAGQLNYYLTDVLAVGVEGQYYVKNLREPFDLVARQARRLPTVNKYNYGAALNFHYVPVYGKFAILDDSIIHWETAFTAGVGFTESEVLPRDPALQPFKNFLITPNVGASMRFFVTKFLTVNVGIRDYIFVDRFEAVDRTEVSGEAAKQDADSALINNVVFQAGLSFWFPTSFEYTTFR